MTGCCSHIMKMFYLSPSRSGKFGKRCVASSPLFPVSRHVWYTKSCVYICMCACVGIMVLYLAQDISIVRETKERKVRWHTHTHTHLHTHTHERAHSRYPTCPVFWSVRSDGIDLGRGLLGGFPSCK